MRSSLNFISLIFIVYGNISLSYAFILSKNYSKNVNISNNKFLINDSKIGIVDFRNILKESSTMKKLGKEFLKFEKKLNDKIKKEEKILRNREFKLTSKKNKISINQYNI